MENMKRIADNSPDGGPKKRSVFNDITNAIACTIRTNQKKTVAKLVKKATKKSKRLPKQKEKKNVERVNVEEDPSQEIDDSPSPSMIEESCTEESEETAEDTKLKLLPVVPANVNDFDRENINDPFSEPLYAVDIFDYYKEREKDFKVVKYMTHQPELTKSMRAVLVDWMVEVQESFELNHETLYLAVKLVDHYLMKQLVSKSNLQLVGSTAIFIASKYDERCPPSIDDFLYICDDAYSREELIAMEINILKDINFDLGMPLSYRFLRRYARCGKASIETLTLARFILETSLMDYDMIEILDSLLAAAALLLALRMKKLEEWTPTLEFYSGYSAAELESLVCRLNALLLTPSKNLTTIRTKYSNKVFFEVAKIAPLQDLV